VKYAIGRNGKIQIDLIERRSAPVERIKIDFEKINVYPKASGRGGITA
jgi:hypothetical protein